MPRRAIRPVFDRLTSTRLPTRGTAWHVVGLPRTGPLPSGCGRDSGRLHGSAPPSGGDPSGRNPHGGFRPAKRNGRPGPPHLRGGGSGGAAAVLEARLPPEPPAAGQVTSRRKEIPHPSVDSSRRISPACRRAVDRTLETGARRLSVAGPERHAGSVARNAKGTPMQQLSPRSYDDHVRLYALAQLQGYGLALGVGGNRHDQRRPLSRGVAKRRPRRSLISHAVRFVSGRRRVATSAPEPC